MLEYCSGYSIFPEQRGNSGLLQMKAEAGSSITNNLSLTAVLWHLLRHLCRHSYRKISELKRKLTGANRGVSTAPICRVCFLVCSNGSLNTIQYHSSVQSQQGHCSLQLTNKLWELTPFKQERISCQAQL